MKIFKKISKIRWETATTEAPYKPTAKSTTQQKNDTKII
jgi:hypothetical protein